MGCYGPAPERTHVLVIKLARTPCAEVEQFTRDAEASYSSLMRMGQSVSVTGKKLQEKRPAVIRECLGRGGSAGLRSA